MFGRAHGWHRQCIRRTSGGKLNAGTALYITCSSPGHPWPVQDDGKPNLATERQVLLLPFSMVTERLTSPPSHCYACKNVRDDEQSERPRNRRRHLNIRGFLPMLGVCGGSQPRKKLCLPGSSWRLFQAVTETGHLAKKTLATSSNANEPERDLQEPQHEFASRMWTRFNAIVR